jgi:hypothetical protein
MRRELATRQPHQLRVADRAGDTWLVGVPPAGRKKWAAVTEVLEARPWVRAELLDRQGAVIGYLTPDEQPRMATGDEPAPAGAAWLIQAMLHAQETALSYRDREVRVLLENVAGVIQAHGSAVQSLVQILAASRDVAAEVAAARQKLEQTDLVGQLTELAEHAPQLAGAVASIVQAVGAVRAAKAARPTSPAVGTPQK